MTSVKLHMPCIALHLCMAGREGGLKRMQWHSQNIADFFVWSLTNSGGFNAENMPERSDSVEQQCDRPACIPFSLFDPLVVYRNTHAFANPTATTPLALGSREWSFCCQWTGRAQET